MSLASDVSAANIGLSFIYSKLLMSNSRWSFTTGSIPGINWPLGWFLSSLLVTAGVSDTDHRSGAEHDGGGGLLVVLVLVGGRLLLVLRLWMIHGHVEWRLVDHNVTRMLVHRRGGLAEWCHIWT